MLELKQEVKEAGLDVAIFVSKSKGRRLVFPIDTPQCEYQKYAELGFRIFRCVECGSDNCYGDCDPVGDNMSLASIYGDVDFIEEDTKFDLQETYDKIMSEEADVVEVEVDIEEEENFGKEKTKEEVQTENYNELSLSDLRELFPNIKSTSKKGFLEKIAEESK